MPKKLLLADDSVTVQRVIELTFKDEGMQVVAVSDGRQAIDKVPQERPDIVLADVTMPERDGYEVAASIKANPDLSHIPVVLMTGAFEQIDEVRAREVGCDGVLAKPFEPHMAIALVRQLLAGDRPGLAVAEVSALPPMVTGVAAGYPFDGPPAATSLDDYFDRLDEALSQAASGAEESAPRFDLPPAEAVARDEAASYAASEPHQSLEPAVGIDPTPVPGPPADLADAFSALLAEELGEGTEGAPFGVPEAARPSRMAAQAPAPPAITDEFIDEVARRVSGRLADRAVQEAVSAQVLALAERLVREEIDRIKAQA